MKTSTLAFVYVLSAGIMFFVSKFLYLNRIVDHWVPVWFDAMALVTIAAIVAVVYLHRRKV